MTETKGGTVVSTTAPHILLVNVFFAPFSYGGATIVAEQVAYAYRRQTGGRVTAVSLCSRSDLEDYALVKSEKNGVVNYLINVPAGRNYTQLYDNPAVVAHLELLMDQLTPDVLHAHCVQDVGAGILRAARDRGLKVILSVHDFWWLCERQFMIKMDQSYCGQNPILINNCRGCAENFDAAVTRFEFLRTQSTFADIITYPSQFALTLSEASGFGVGKGVVWENGVHLPGPDFEGAQAARRASDPQLVFGFVGGPSGIKGWPQIRAAFKKLETENFQVLVVDGSLDGSWWADQDLSKLPGDWQVHPRFSQTEMDAFYSKIDVLLFMSQWKETFGLVIREALARGIHVIQTDSGGTVEHGVIRQADLIPIGADPDVLQNILQTTLVAHPCYKTSHPMTCFDTQAVVLCQLIQELYTDIKQ